MSFNPLQWDYI